MVAKKGDPFSLCFVATAAAATAVVVLPPDEDGRRKRSAPSPTKTNQPTEDRPPVPVPPCVSMPQNEFWGSNPEAGKAELGCNYFPLFLSLFPFAFDGAHHIVNGSVDASDDRRWFVTRRVSLCDLSRHRNRQQQKVRDTAQGESPSHLARFLSLRLFSCLFPFFLHFSQSLSRSLRPMRCSINHGAAAVFN